MSMIKSGSPKFNLNFHNKLKKNTPKNIIDIGIEFKDIPTGIIRFDNKQVSYIYLDIDLKGFKACILRFKYNNGNLVFKNIYFGFLILPLPISSFKRKFYEFRFNSKLEFDSIYQHIGSKNQVLYKEGFLICTKGNESYWVNSKIRDFTKEIKMLHNKKIIKLFTGSTELTHLLRDNKDSIYIKIGKRKYRY